MTISTTTLKNAARAIECDLWTDPATGANYLAKDGAILRRWEPATDHGDSFCLMVALGLDVLNDQSSATVKKFDSFNQRVVAMYTEYDGKRDSRAMLAILQCAAQIGAKLCQ